MAGYRERKVAKKDLAAAKKYVKKGASMTSVGESYGVTAGSISQRLRRFIARNKKDELAIEVKKKIAANRKN